MQGRFHVRFEIFLVETGSNRAKQKFRHPEIRNDRLPTASILSLTCFISWRESILKSVVLQDYFFFAWPLVDIFRGYMYYKYIRTD